MAPHLVRHAPFGIEGESVSRAAEEQRTATFPLRVELVVAVVALALGVVLGNNTAIGAKKLTVHEGSAYLHNTENWLTSFDPEDPDDQLAFHANAVYWSDGSSSGEGHPPCLSKGRAVPVRVGYSRVELPDGGFRSVVSWVECGR
jgi:hypothetical protein